MLKKMRSNSLFIVFSLLIIIFFAGCNHDSDTEAPVNKTMSNFINSGAAEITSQGITLSISARDNENVAAYYISESSTTPDKSASGWVGIEPPVKDYSADISFTLSSENEEKIIYVWFKDEAGNVSNAVSDSIIFTVSTFEIQGHTVNSDHITAVEIGAYQVLLTLHDPYDEIRQASVTGPGIFDFLTEMTKTPGIDETFETEWTIVAFSETIPSGELLYTFTIETNDTTITENYTVENNFIDLVTNMSPVMDEILSDQPVFTWDGIVEENVEYSIILKKMTDIYGIQILSVVDTQNVTATTWESDDILEDGDYVWSANAFIKDADGNITAMSMSKELSFTLSQY